MVRKVVRTSLVDQVHDLILERIQNRELLPGDRLNIEELARDFGVSRTPVRETINQLIKEGFVEQKHNVGPSVVDLSDEQAHDLIEANASLFNLIFDLYIDPNKVNQLQEELGNVILGQIRSSESGDDLLFHKKSVEFHKVIIEYCTNPIIKDYTMKTQNQINMCTFSYLATKDNHKGSISDHTGIKDAIAEGNIQKAKVLMEAHNKFAGTAFFTER